MSSAMCFLFIFYSHIFFVVTGLSVPQGIRPSRLNPSTLLINPSTPFINGSVPVKYDAEVICDPDLGSPVNKASCENAFHRMTSGTQLRSFGWRRTGRFDIALPLRILSSGSFIYIRCLVPLCARIGDSWLIANLV